MEIRLLLILHTAEDLAYANDVFSREKDIQWSITHVDSLFRAIEILTTTKFDLVFAGWQLPDCHNGLDSLKRIRAYTHGAPIVFLATNVDDNQAQKATMMGAMDVLQRGKPETSLAQKLVRYVFEKHRLMREIQELTLNDPTTGLINRRGFVFLFDYHRQLIEKSPAASAFYLVEVDRLKFINDRFGHNEGDRAVSYAADICRALFRPANMLCRLEEDLFGVFFATPPGETEEQLRARLGEATKALTRDKKIPYPFGLSFAALPIPPQQLPSGKQVLEQALQELSRVKGKR